MQNINVKLLDEMLKSQSSNEILASSFKNMRPKKKDFLKCTIMFLISLIPACLIGISEETVSIFCYSLEKINDVILAIFGVVFTGYVFFQALVNDELLLRLLNQETQKDKKKISKLQETNEEFVYLMMMCVISIIVNIFLIVCVGAIPEDFNLLNKRLYNNIIASAMLEVYFTFVFSVLWSIKSFIFNIFELFKLHAGTRVIEIINKTEDSED